MPASPCRKPIPRRSRRWASDVPQIAFDLGGVAVACHAAQAAALAPLRELLAGFPQARRPADWRVLLLARPALPFAAAGGAPRAGSLPEGTPLLAAWWPGGRQFLVDGRLGIRIDYARRLAVCRLGGAAPLLAGTAGIALCDAILEQAGQHLQHAALLALPPALGGGGLLLLGESGAGKSSTALALARGGWALAGDDAAVLRQDAAGPVTAWGFPRALKAHPVTAGLLPWLQALVPARGEAEVEIEPADLAPLVACAPPGERLPLRAVAFLGPRGEQHRAESLTASETVLRLAAAQLHAPDRRLSPAVREQFALLAGLAAQAQWRLALNLGPDLAGLPGWLEGIFLSRHSRA